MNCFVAIVGSRVMAYVYAGGAAVVERDGALAVP